MNLLFRRGEVKKGKLARLLRKDQVEKIFKNKAFLKKLDRRMADFESGKEKGYTWEEVKEILEEKKQNRG